MELDSDMMDALMAQQFLNTAALFLIASKLKEKKRDHKERRHKKSVRKSKTVVAEPPVPTAQTVDPQNANRKRRFWVREIFKDRAKCGYGSALLTELRTRDQEYYFQFMRMTPELFDKILNKVAGSIEKKHTYWRRSIAASDRLAITLRFLATGETYRDLSFAFRVGWQTISKIVPVTCDAIWNCFVDEYMRFPSTPEEWMQIASGFETRWKLPHCCGTIDGKHVIRSCYVNASTPNLNYRGAFSTVLLAVTDSNYRFVTVDYGDYEADPNAGIFSKYELGRRLVSGRLNFPEPEKLPNSDKIGSYFLIGDEAFPLRHNLLRPYPRRVCSIDQSIFNYRLSRAHRVADNSFGILAAKFRVFQRPFNYGDKSTRSMVLACCLLHNMLIEESPKNQSPLELCDKEDAHHNWQPGKWRTETSGGLQDLQQLGSNMYSKRAKATRETFMDYLCNEGAVEWQKKMVESIPEVASVACSSASTCGREPKEAGTMAAFGQKRKRDGSVLGKCDDFLTNAVRAKVRKLMSNNTEPTARKVLEAVNDDPELPNFEKSGFYQLLHKIGIRFLKRKKPEAPRPKFRKLEMERGHRKRLSESERLLLRRLRNESTLKKFGQYSVGTRKTIRHNSQLATQRIRLQNSPQKFPTSSRVSQVAANSAGTRNVLLPQLLSRPSTFSGVSPVAAQPIGMQSILLPPQFANSTTGVSQIATQSPVRPRLLLPQNPPQAGNKSGGNDETVTVLVDLQTFLQSMGRPEPQIILPIQTMPGKPQEKIIQGPPRNATANQKKGELPSAGNQIQIVTIKQEPIDNLAADSRAKAIGDDVTSVSTSVAKMSANGSVSRCHIPQEFAPRSNTCRSSSSKELAPSAGADSRLDGNSFREFTYFQEASAKDEVILPDLNNSVRHSPVNILDERVVIKREPVSDEETVEMATSSVEKSKEHKAGDDDGESWCVISDIVSLG